MEQRIQDKFKLIREQKATAKLKEEGIQEDLIIDSNDPNDMTSKPTGVTANWQGSGKPKSILRFIPRNVDEPATGGTVAFG